MKRLASPTEKGFTLVELLVAASILVTAVGAPLYVGVRGIVLATEAKDKITATFLAEEGMELARNVRDSNVLKLLSDTNAQDPLGWKDGFVTDSSTGVTQPLCEQTATNVGCKIGRTAGNFVNEIIEIDPCGLECTPLLVRTAGPSETYGYNGSYPESRFRRTVSITNIGSGSNEIKVQSKVEWYNRGAYRYVLVEELMYGYGLP